MASASRGQPRGRSRSGRGGGAQGVGGDARLLPVRSLHGVSGDAVLRGMHERQRRHPIKAVWDPSLRLPVELVEYVCGVCADLPAQVRQEAVLLLKRYVWRSQDRASLSKAGLPRNIQVVALMCAHLAAKHWQHAGIPEQKLHWLSRNSYTREDFVQAELEVMDALDCNVHWEGVLLAEWIKMLLYQVELLLADPSDVGPIHGVADHLADVLAFQDDLMSQRWPSELAAAAIHAAVLLCTKQFGRYMVSLRVGHLCRAQEEQVVQLSERILGAAIGRKCKELILEGSGLTAEDSLSEASGGSRRSPRKRARGGARRPASGSSSDRRRVRLKPRRA